ncbi:protein of unknown function [Acidithiobacillus ferrivorans]|uniref:Uncharacterized protein n=1 Tax=Acidithiobacillus ferrivorans TaxID=160808 RepID=A0ABY1MPP8_9PROT|nr:protein of unknown function [Acidithiobacillus ferrivorans]
MGHIRSDLPRQFRGNIHAWGIHTGGGGFSSQIWRTLHLAADSDDRYRRYSGQLWGLWPWQPVQPSYPAALGPMDWNYRAAPGEDGLFFQAAQSRGSHAGALHCSLAQLQGYVADSAKMGFWRFAWWRLLGAMAWVLVCGAVAGG